MPENYCVASKRLHNGWISDPDLAADPALCAKVYQTIIHSWANRYNATGQEIIDMAMKLTNPATSDLLKALKDLFKHCAMVHKHWGENCNQKEADLAISTALAAITKAKGR
jgi:hypothetical protein